MKTGSKWKKNEISNVWKFIQKVYRREREEVKSVRMENKEESWLKCQVQRGRRKKRRVNSKVRKLIKKVEKKPDWKSKMLSRK